jgi:hypothetical protein
MAIERKYFLFFLGLHQRDLRLKVMFAELKEGGTGSGSVA